MAARLLIVPGLHDSGPAHWQSLLQAGQRRAVRVTQRDWTTADLDRWAERIGHTLDRAGPGPWIADAHSFGCLALARHLARHRESVRAALLVAPADPRQFGIEALLPHEPLPMPSVLVGSETDPWMAAERARDWAERWGCRWVKLGDSGQIIAVAGFGPFPLARRWVTAMTQRLARRARPPASASGTFLAS
jgi:predicted alpha/beta hydrolase family esterase